MDLQESRQACNSLNLKAKIHREPWEADADKSAALSARYDALQAEHVAAQARLAHLIVMVRRAEACFYEHLTSNAFGADGWRELYQQLVGAVRPLFVHRD